MVGSEVLICVGKNSVGVVRCAFSKLGSLRGMPWQAHHTLVENFCTNRTLNAPKMNTCLCSWLVDFHLQNDLEECGRVSQHTHFSQLDLPASLKLVLPGLALWSNLFCEDIPRLPQLMYAKEIIQVDYQLTSIALACGSKSSNLRVSHLQLKAPLKTPKHFL